MLVREGEGCELGSCEMSLEELERRGRGVAASDFLSVFVVEVATSLVCVSIDLRDDELL